MKLILIASLVILGIQSTVQGKEISVNTKSTQAKTIQN